MQHWKRNMETSFVKSLIVKNINMRKTIHTLSCLLLLFYFKANAQGFKAGFSAGLVATDVYGADIHDNDADFYKAGFVGGGTVSLAVRIFCVTSLDFLPLPSERTNSTEPIISPFLA